ncbi:MAG: Holliday junction branch migration protein RuvA [Candidatus Terrybacteria bacterium]|nr:Holliday junction branch migration protein RuvA [Candidatus Terrybacteria bacterium]
MIATLSGILKAKDGRSCIVEVHGVGFKAFVSSATAGDLPELEKSVTLATALRVNEREGTIDLYGFTSERELALFHLLLEVQGVGPRGALNILSAATVDELERAIAAGDEKLLVRVSGIGRKKAQKILIELKERYEGLALAEGESMKDIADVLDALKSLGYSEREAREAVRNLPKGLATMEEKIRASLRNLGQGS